MTGLRHSMIAGLICSVGILGSGCSRPQWELGVQTYTFRTYTLVESIDKVAALGLDEIEAFSGQRVAEEFGDMRLDHNSSPEARAAVKAKLEEADVEMSAYYFHHLGQSEETDRKIFELAREMGVETIVSEPPPDKLAYIDGLANEYGIDVAIHEHVKQPDNPGYVYWNPAALAELLDERSDRMGACADTGHWTRSGVIPVEGLKILEGRIKCMHLKDMDKRTPEGKDVVWGTGLSDMTAIIAEMKRQGFDGLAAIEYEENPQDNMAEVAACIKFHDDVVDNLSGW